MEGMYSNVQSGIIGLEMSLHHNAAATRNGSHQQIPHHPMGAYDHPPAQQAPAPAYPLPAGKPKSQALTLSDDDDPVPVPGITPENSTDDGTRRPSLSSPWQRMKWTDNMVRLLIMVVFYIGDEVGSEGAADPSAKKKVGSGGGGGGGGGVLQKKGKWKSVSRAMMERGFYVSPQQCEDKFNDLNKRYKRVNDILGKGTACRVVENQSLLDTMDHLSPKTKDEVKKLLNSKHLFFREMCAYHNSCGHATATAAAPQHQPEASQCLHSTGTPPNLNESSKLGTNEDEDEDEDEEEDNDKEDEDNEGDIPEGSHSNPRKRIRIEKETARIAAVVQELGSEVVGVQQDGTKTAWEKIQWMKVKEMQLEEERLGIRMVSLELEKQKLKWLKYSGKKEREMEREKVENERRKVENERMVLLVKQKELDIMEQQHSGGNRKSDLSSITGTG